MPELHRKDTGTAAVSRESIEDRLGRLSMRLHHYREFRDTVAGWLEDVERDCRSIEESIEHLRDAGKRLFEDFDA